MKTPYLDQEIKKLEMQLDLGTFQPHSEKALNELKNIKKQLTIPVVVKSFYCNSNDGGYNNDPCAEQCRFCKGVGSLQ